ncbi:MAG TPA: hypothetical protein VFL59_17000 [Candidatus Nanopelagicales bacterium]|nr:hypothetical protein [Candidatus Nanopelagicales bacterium]
MSSVRELLEQAGPVEHRVPLPAAEIRRRGDRRRRRGYAVGAAVAVAGVALAAFVGVQVLDSVGPRPDGNVATTPTPTPSLSGQPVRALEGTRWIPDLVVFNAATSQAYPGESGSAARALLTFEPGGVLVLDVMLPGRPVTTLRGTWQAAAADPQLGPALRASVRLSIIAPEGSPDGIVSLVTRLSLIRTAEGYTSSGPPASLTGLTLWLYDTSHTSVIGAIDLVQPGAVLPSPYPARP